MADEITIKPKSESTPTNAAPENKTVSLNRTQLVNLCAAGLGVSFFLPWAQLFGANLSGFDLQKMGCCAPSDVLTAPMTPMPMMADERMIFVMDEW